jgi:hypothetical protein
VSVRAAVVAAAAAALACAGAPVASSGGAPDWVGGTPAQFPGERFVTGVGVADERAAAEARARAAVAAVLETHVAAVTKVREEETRTAGGGGEAVASKVAVSQEVVAATAALVEGAAIAAAWTDPRGQLHVLAVLDRAAAAAPLREKLAAGDAAAIAARARLNGGIDRATAARLGYRILSLLAAREQLAVRIRALQPAADAALPAALAGAGEAARSALSAPVVRVDAAGPGAPPVAAAVSRALGAVGLGTVAPTAAPDLLAAVSIEEAAPVAAGAWTTARATARVRVERAGAGAGEAWAEIVESAKGTATQPAEAGRRAAAALAKQVEERLAEALRKQLERP